MSNSPASPQLEPAEPAAAKLSDELQGVLNKMHEAPMTIGAMQQLLKGRGFMLLLVVLVAPFAVLPIAPPGLTIPVGVATIVIGVRLSLGMSPWLPKRVLDRNVGNFMKKLLTKMVPVMRRLEKWFQERWTFLLWPGFTNLIGVSLAWCAILLMMPPPMVNPLPAAAIILLAIGFMLRDGLLLVLGYVVMAGTTFYLVLVAGTIWALVMSVVGWIGSLGG